MKNRVDYKQAGGVARVTMDDGKANIMSLAMLRELSDAFDQAERDQAVVILRSGREDIFSAGFDRLKQSGIEHIFTTDSFRDQPASDYVTEVKLCTIL